MMTELQGIYSNKENTLKYKFGTREKTLLSIFLFAFINFDSAILTYPLFP